MIFDNYIPITYDNYMKDDKMPGIITGVVKENYNKDYAGMILVDLHYGDNKTTTTQWIRVMQPYCGNGFGNYFIPEVDSEVVISFLRGDINYPIVIGSLWNNSSELPAGKHTEKNSIKSIRTKGGHEIIFNETKDQEKIEVKTIKGHSLIFDDKASSIVIKDKDGKNSICIDAEKGEITVNAEKKVSLNAGGKGSITLSSDDKVSIEAGTININAKQSLTIKGQSISINGNTSTEIKSGASMKVEATGLLNLKGSMTKIN